MHIKFLSLAALLIFGACRSPSPQAQPPLKPAGPAAPAAILEIDLLPPSTIHGGQAREASAIDMILVHTIGGAVCTNGKVMFTGAAGTAVFWRDWFAQQTDKSIHYVIDRGGQIAQQRPDLRTAGHVSSNAVAGHVNARSIGIELVNRGDGIEPFPEVQVAALEALAAELAGRYGLRPDALRTHAELDLRMQPDCGGVPLRRNVDPGALFPAARIRAAMAK